MKLTRFFVLVISILLKIVGYSQSTALDADTRAFLFHVVRKSPTLNSNLGYAFEYNGPEIKLSKNELNYDSIEAIIINQPEKLVIRYHILQNSPKGLLAEISNKTAIWSLNKGLNDVRNNISGSKQELVDDYLIAFHEIVSNKVKRNRSYAKLFEPINSPLFNPGISLYDRDLLLKIMGFENVDIRKEILDSQNEAILKLIESYSKVLFEKLGGSYSIYDNVLMAAGDGSYTSGLLDEKEKDDDGNWNKGLPKAVGLFPYQLEIKNGDISPLRISTAILENIPNIEYTNLHFDVWGYNTNKQTTVIIEKDNKTYRLFGSSKTKFLSPDSSFSDGITIQKIINDIANQEYLSLKRRLFKVEDEIQMIQRSIEELKIKISMITTKSSKKGKRRKKRNKSRLKEYKHQDKELSEILIDLFEEKAEIEKPYFATKDKIDYYKKNLGDNLVAFTEKNGLYTFDDSTVFNLETQELFFQNNSSNSPIIIRLIAIPDNKSCDDADEVMLHVSRVDYNPFQFPDITIELKDIFKSDSYSLEKSIHIRNQDSINLANIFKRMKKIRPIYFELKGNGIGKWKNGKLTKDLSQNKLDVYPGKTDEEKTMNKNSFAFSSLRRTSVSVKFDYQLHLSIVSYTDPVNSNFKTLKKWQSKALNENQFSKNDLLSAYRTLTALKEMKSRIFQIAKRNMSKKLFDEFQLQFVNDLNKVSIQIGNSNYELNLFRL